MTIAELRTRLHSLVDKIDDKEVLAQFFDILSLSPNEKEGMIWDTLTKEEQQRVMDAYTESESEENLIDHKRVIQENIGGFQS
jgi:hypothetical protein